jgi:hypothetical protein
MPGGGRFLSTGNSGTANPVLSDKNGAQTLSAELME